MHAMDDNDGAELPLRPCRRAVSDPATPIDLGLGFSEPELDDLRKNCAKRGLTLAQLISRAIAVAAPIEDTILSGGRLILRRAFSTDATPDTTIDYEVLIDFRS